MRHVALGRTRLSVSVLGAGSNALAEYSQEQAGFIYNYALDQGVNFIVTSAAYQVVEPKIAKAVADRKDEFCLATTTDHRGAKNAKADIENSLRLFRTDHIELYQVGGVRNQRAVDLALEPGGAMDALQEAKREGRIGAIGITGHVPDVLAYAVKTGLFDAVFFILNMANTYALSDLMPLARSMNVGMMVMRPLGHGALARPERALRFALCSGAEAVMCGMYSKEEIETAIAVAEPPITDEERASLMAEAESLPRTGCRLCGLCEPCPKGISISYLMELYHYRARYGLLAKAEEQWLRAAAKAKECDDCRECEKRCPYQLSIAPVIHAAAEGRYPAK